MKNVSLALLLMGVAFVSAAQDGQHISEKDQAKQLICDAAAKQLPESAAQGVALRMTVDDRGRVETFTTESPKGLRLEKMKEVAAAVKAMHFKPATKDGSPVRVQIRIEFDCTSEPSKN
jgi:TonB family protein